MPIRPAAQRGAYLALGASALLGQVLLLREMLVIFSGNELVLGVVFGIWLASIALGAAVGGRVAARSARPAAWLAGALTALGPVLVGQVMAIRALRGILGLEAGSLLPLTSLLASAPLVVAPLPLLVGLAFAPACRVAREAVGRDVDAAGRVYALEAAGSLLAGLVYSFVLAGRMPSVPVAGLAEAVAGLGALAVARGRARLVAALVLAAGIVLAFTPAGASLDRAGVERRWADLAPGRRLVESTETRYGVLEIGERDDQYDLFVSGGYAGSFPDPWAAGTPAHLALCAHPRPRRVLVVGGGSDGLLQAMTTHAVVERIEHAEMDPGIAALVRRHLPEELRAGLDDPRVVLLAIDGRRAVVESDARYDVVLVNVPEPTSALLDRFYTVEFFRAVRRALREGGVAVIRIEAPLAYARGEETAVLAVVSRSLAEVFAHRRLLVAGDESYLVASESAEVLTSDPAVLGRRYRAQGAVDPAFFPTDLDPDRVFIGVVTPGRARELRDEIAGRSGPLNRDGHPVAILHALVLFDRFSGGGASDLFRRLAGAPRGAPAAVAGALALLLVLLVGALRRRPAGRTLAATGVIATTGFTAMTLEMALLLRMQSSQGHVYGMVGAVVAVFMAGLAAGAVVGTRGLARRAWSPGRWLGLTHAAVIVLTLAAPALLTALGGLDETPGLAGFLAFAALAGALTGLEFPCAVAFRLAGGGTALARSAGSLDAADHAGAALGAVITGVVLLPLAGQAGACLAAAALATGALMALVVAARSSR